MPGRRRRELEQGPLPARLEVRELGGAVVPRDIQTSVLDAVVEPRAAEDELAEPVDERFPADERQPLPMANEVAAELAARLLDHAVRGELDEVGRLVVVELVVVDEAEPERRRADPLGEVVGVEAEAEAEELDDHVVARRVVVHVHGKQDIGASRLACVTTKAALASGLMTTGLVLLVVWLFDVSLERAAVLAPLIVVAFGAAAGLVVLWAKVGWESLQRRRRPWLVVALAAGALAVIAALSLLGLELPRE